MNMSEKEKKLRPEQSQERPGIEKVMLPLPVTEPIQYPTEGKLFQKKVIITGGDSGIGKAVALLFAQEGADVCIVYLSEEEEAVNTKKEVEAYGVMCIAIQADLSIENECKKVVNTVVNQLKGLDVLINNAGLHWEAKTLTDISSKQWNHTFDNNVNSMFWMTKYALPYLNKGASIINTTSVTAYRGSDHLIDYATTKGAIVSFTRSLASNLVSKGIRVNAVAPGAVWTPLIASSFSEDDVATFGSDNPMKRAAMPNEIAPAYLFLASQDASFFTGQVLHPNGGEIVNG